MSLPDLVAGVVWAGAALLWVRRPGSTAAYAGVVAVTWFAAEAGFAVFWHRFAVILLVVCAPRWVPRTWAGRSILIVQLAAAATVVPWTLPVGAALLGSGVVVALAVDQPHAGLRRWTAAVFAAIAFAGPALLAPRGVGAAVTEWLYAGAMVIVALLLVGDSVARPRRLDLLVDVEESEPASARERAAADRLRERHEGLLGEIDAGVAELRRSRRRLAEARLTAVSGLRADLEARIVSPLATVADSATLGNARLEAAREHVRIALRDIEAIAGGLGPRSLADGLSASLLELASTTALRIELSLEDDALSLVDDVASRTAYFVCAEAVANAVKHSRGSLLRLSLSMSGPAEVTVGAVDDGAGGADASGTGLIGLADRVEAVGGRLMIRSDASGTSVTAALPCRPAPSPSLAVSSPEAAGR